MRVGVDGKVVIVTGAAQGIGRAVAVRVATAGARGVLVTDRQPAHEVMAEVSGLGVAAGFVQADLAEDAAAAVIVEAALSRFGRVDGLVNAAGATTRAGVADARPESFDALFKVNTRSPLFLMQRCILAMRAAGQGGAIVNILSANVHGGTADLGIYAASKAALALLTRNAAHAHRFDRIRVNGINVGWTDTPGERRTQAATYGHAEAWMQARAAEQPFGRLLQPDDVARLALFLLSDAASPMTGSVIDQEQWVVGARD